jgi:hypothetical protein
MPVVPQVVAAVAAHRPWGSVPLCTSLHTPGEAFRLHALHAPVHAVSQHLPCAQCPVPHSASVEQSSPCAFFPHELMFPSCPQMFGATHWSLVVQAPKHLFALQ